MKLSSRCLHSLRHIAASGSCWSIMMAQSFFDDAMKLQDGGLVTFTQRVNRRGRGDGSDVSATAEGLKVLKQHKMLPAHREADLA